jgi:hypothetical protein
MTDTDQQQQPLDNAPTPPIPEPASKGPGEWAEIRVQGKLPERRSNHAAFIQNSSKNYYYIHGGRDLKEGALDNMWRINLDGVKQLQNDPNSSVEWELVEPKGQSPGRISHHQCICVDDTMILIGGQTGDEDNGTIYSLDLKKLQWSTIKQEGDIPEGRDDHSLVKVSDRQYLVFGGFVSGSRTNDVYQLEYQGNSVTWTELYHSDDSSSNVPAPRSSHCSGFNNGTMFVYGGEDEDHVKLDDMWAFSVDSRSWSKVDNGGVGGRSGHSSSMMGSTMYIFGGILEVTKELNDLIVFDCASQSLQKSPSKDKSPPTHLSVKTHSMIKQASDVAGSPGMRGQSPGMRGRAPGLGMSSSKNKSGFSPNRRA